MIYRIYLFKGSFSMALLVYQRVALWESRGWVWHHVFQNVEAMRSRISEGEVEAAASPAPKPTSESFGSTKRSKVSVAAAHSWYILHHQCV
jgi:hypothetical protein